MALLTLWLLSGPGAACAGTRTSDTAETVMPGYVELTLARRMAVVDLGPELSAPRTKRLVEVEVTEIRNPLRVPLSIELRYRTESGEALYLGLFSFFPPDNPGTFKVATGGKLRTAGQLVLTLVPLVPMEDSDAQVNVRIGRIRLLE